MMETSDSEYFESADEDLNSDSEESEKSKHKKCENLYQTNNELKYEHITNVQNRTVQKPKHNEKDFGDTTLIEGIINSGQLESTNEKCLVVSNKKEGVDNSVENPLSDIEYESNSFSSEHTESNTLLDVLSNENIHENVKSNTDKKTEVEPLPIEENLWDDDEIDWETEGAKESKQISEKNKLVSKNEDSGWDDFEAEWESESSPTTMSLSEFNNEHSSKLSTPQRDSYQKCVAENQVRDNHWDEDDWESVEKPADKPKHSDEQSGWSSGWGSWGVSSLLSTATQSVSSLTSHVSHGLSTVLESSIGIPDAEELARMDKLHEKVNDGNEENKYDESSAFGLDGLVLGMSQLTKFVESTGSKVITGGLDTLEAIGKKTVEVLQEGDPGLKKKRAFLKLDSGKPNLSQILREAKEKAEEESISNKEKMTETKRFKNYETLFDDHQGLVHLEALEMLSKLCSIKLNNLQNSLSSEALKDMLETLEQVKELCELPEEEEENISLAECEEIIKNAVKEINIPITYDKLFRTCEEGECWLQNVNLNSIDDTEIHQQAIENLAQLTSLAVEQFHKTGELLMVKEHRSTADEADSLVQITSTIKSLITIQAGKFTDKLNSLENVSKDTISEHITDIFYEAANSGSYIQDALQLLIPVLQVGAV